MSGCGASGEGAHHPQGDPCSLAFGFERLCLTERESLGRDAAQLLDVAPHDPRGVLRAVVPDLTVRPEQLEANRPGLLACMVERPRQGAMYQVGDVRTAGVGSAGSPSGPRTSR